MSVVSANNNALSAITALPSSVAGGSMNLITTATASTSANLSFTSGIDSTYKSYIFKFYNMHPGTGAAKFTMIGSTDGGDNYGVATTTSMFEAMQDEAGNNAVVRYEDGDDAHQTTSAFNISTGIGADADECLSGDLHLFEPSSTVFVKHFNSTIQLVNNSGTPYCKSTRVGGYFNTTSAINAIQFSFSSGNIDSGVIKLYGIS